jgi:presenilin 1
MSQKADNKKYEALKQSSSQEIQEIDENNHKNSTVHNNISSNSHETHIEYRNYHPITNQNSDSEVTPASTSNVNNQNNQAVSIPETIPEDPKLKQELDEYIEKQKELLLNPIENLSQEEYSKILSEYKYLLNLYKQKTINPEQKNSLNERHRQIVRFQYQHLNPKQQQQYLAQQRENAKAKKLKEAETKKKEMYDNLRYYAKEISLIIRPVILCICLSILWVKLTIEVDTTLITSTDLNIITGGENDSSDGSGSSGFNYKQILNSLMNAGLIIGNIVLATFIILFLFKFNCTKALYGLFILTVFMLIGIFGYNLSSILIYTYNIPIDWITLIIFMFNLSIVGVIVIFWKGPPKIQQGYLILMSSLMAFSLTNLADWTTWILLALLACWDLIAVLCPFGPLKMLVEHSDSNKQMIPQALVYSTMIWMMAKDVRIKVNNENDGKYEFHELTHIPSTQFDEGEASSMCSTKELIDTKQKIKGKIADKEDYRIEINEDAKSDISNQNKNNNQLVENNDNNNNNNNAEQQSLTNNNNSQQGSHITRSRRNSNHEQNNNNSNNNSNDNDDDDDDDEEEGLKLGLGDFVFYSVLIARAAMHDWITTFSCAIAVLTGLTLTIFLLSIYQKALPALPISIVLGIIFYIFSSSILGSLMKFLTRIPEIEGTMKNYSGLKIKIDNGCGFVYL